MKQILNLLVRSTEKIFNRIGAVINQCPGKEELKKVRHSPIFFSSFIKMKRSSCWPINGKDQFADPHPRGETHSETRTFNKFRK